MVQGFPVLEERVGAWDGAQGSPWAQEGPQDGCPVGHRRGLGVPSAARAARGAGGLGGGRWGPRVPTQAPLPCAGLLMG